MPADAGPVSGRSSTDRKRRSALKVRPSRSAVVPAGTDTPPALEHEDGPTALRTLLVVDDDRSAGLNSSVRIACVGGGPAGLFFAIAMKLLDPEHEITVFERNPPDVTSGWGVTYTDELLDRLQRQDPVLAKQVREHSVVWEGMRTVLYGGRSARGGGYGFAIARNTLLAILAQRAREVGAEIRYRAQVCDLASCPAADLIVAADGANSRIRQSLSERFNTRCDAGRNRYIWFGTEQMFGELVFALERTSAGLVWLHGYPYSSAMSTCVVECSAATWRELGLDCADRAGVERLTEVFCEVLGGQALLDRCSGGEPARWQHFEHVRNESWYHQNVVLLGDAAHTTHFSLGAGTEEAITDAGVLARRLHRYPDLPAALASYDRGRRPALEELQAQARASMAEYERIDRIAHLDAVAFLGVLAGRNSSLRPAGYRDRLGQTRPVRAIGRRVDTAVRRARADRRERRNGR